MMLLVFPDQAQDIHAQLSLTHGPVHAVTKITFHRKTIAFTYKKVKLPKAEKTHPVLPLKGPI